jgi:hypothetical protein
MAKSRILTFAAIALSVALSASNASSQGNSLKDQITGTWALSSYDGIAADGARKPVFGASPKGTLILNANGRYAMIIVDANRPKKWTSKSREGAPAEELASAARGLVAQFGEWSVDETDKMLVRKNEGGLNPLAAGREQRVQVSVSGDELKTTDAASGVSGGRAETVWRRIK